MSLDEIKQSTYIVPVITSPKSVDFRTYGPHGATGSMGGARVNGIITSAYAIAPLKVAVMYKPSMDARETRGNIYDFETNYPALIIHSI